MDNQHHENDGVIITEKIEATIDMQKVSGSDVKMAELEAHQHVKRQDESIHTTCINEQKNSETNEKKKKEKEPSVRIYQLFRFASKTDLLLIALAMAGSVGIGALLPSRYREQKKKEKNTALDRT